MSPSVTRRHRRLALAAAAVAVVAVSGGHLVTSTVAPTAEAGPTTGARAGGGEGAGPGAATPGSSSPAETVAVEETSLITPTAATEEVAGGDLGVARPARSPSTAGRSP